MKWPIFVIAVICIMPVQAQEAHHRFLYNNHVRLVADNGKRIRKYALKQPLKIEYYGANGITRAKGKLIFYNPDEIRLLPYGKKEIVSVKIDSITSIQRWNRPGKIGIAILAGTGLAALGLAYITMPSNGQFFQDGDIVNFLLILYAAFDAYYIAAALPIVFLSEAFSKRSADKGYHFYIEEKRKR